MKKNGKFDILRYAFNKKPKDSLSIKPVLHDRYEERKQIPT